LEAEPPWRGVVATSTGLGWRRPATQLAFYQAGVRLSGLLPAFLTRAAATTIGRAASRAPVSSRTALGRGLTMRRDMVARHLRKVYGPGLSDALIARGVDETFSFYARYWAESLRLPTLDASQVEAGVEVHGLEHIDRGLAAGKGVIAALPHLGGWEWGGRWIASTGRPATVVVEALQPPELFEWFVSLRQGNGLEVVPVGPSAGAAALAALAANRILCLLCDRLVSDVPGVEVEFFGERTRLPAGPATLALRKGAPVLPIAAYFGEAPDSHIVEIGAPVEMVRRGRLRDDVVMGTQALAYEIEALIRRAPTQWYLLQPNWPSDLVPAPR
jgi:lauroyl/myristoyl acyltransferase